MNKNMVMILRWNRAEEEFGTSIFSKGVLILLVNPLVHIFIGVCIRVIYMTVFRSLPVFVFVHYFLRGIFIFSHVVTLCGSIF